jgi:hypothetical protein
VTDFITLLAGASSAVTYGIPLAIVGIVVALWVLARFDRSPPLLETVGPDRRWIKSSLDVVDDSARSSQYAPAIAFARQRVGNVLSRRYGISLNAPPFLWKYRNFLPKEATSLLQAGQRLDEAYSLGWRAETWSFPDFVTRRRRQVWRERSRRLFESVLSDLESLLPALEVGE